MHQQLITLENGLRVISLKETDKRSVSLGIWFNVGSRYEEKKEKGIAHFIEHMMFKGSQRFDKDQIKRSIEGVGGTLNAFTSEEFTCYLAKIPYQHIDLTLDVLCDMCLHPVFDAQELEKERSVILEEMKMYKDHPAIYVNELLDRLMWPDCSLGDPVIGYEENLLAMKRSDLVSFRDNFYVPNNTVISVCGYFDSDKLNKKISALFSGYKKKEVRAFKKVSKSSVSPQVKIFKKDTEQTHLSLGFYASKRKSPDRYALAVLNVIMGANMSSRLFDVIREKEGLAYSISSSLRKFHDAGLFLVRSGIKNENLIKYIKLLLQELNRVKQELVSVNEFKRAKDFLIGQLELSLEDTLENMFFAGESIIALGKLDSLDAIVKKIEEVTPEQVKDLANKIFRKEAMNMAIIGPHENKISELILKELTL
ncbi:MAG: pitrilysin family protein [Candidatus Gygaella obscura]|nr:pitrilysin family protein [Candidatus Gygaella obscura]